MSKCDCEKFSSFLKDVLNVGVPAKDVLDRVHKYCPDCNSRIHPYCNFNGEYFNSQLPSKYFRDDNE